MCSEPDCDKPIHCKGLCQAHYRRVQRHGSTEKLSGGPKRNATSTDHRKLDPAEKVRRQAERKTARTHCHKGHALTDDNIYVGKNGKIYCRVCRGNDQRKLRGKEPLDRQVVGPHNSVKTHCNRGHEFTAENTYIDPQDNRRCITCRRITARKSWVWKKYGLDWEDYEALYEAQQGLCAICGDSMEDTPHVDHCHTEGHVRGLLCGRCNIGLGQFRDSVEYLEAAVRYLSK